MKPSIPVAALEQHVAVLGKTGSGKTFATKGLVERWLEERRRVAIVDPTGAWWGLRSSRDGKSPGFEILVLGGDHGDLPLPALGGAAVARLIAEQGVSLVADTSLMTVGERTRWFYDFASTLYRANRAPLHLVLDEAHNFAPQGKVPDPDTGKMLHAANTLASGGRSRGIRLAMITQRPQKLHKDALTSADTLIAMRVLAPHDRSAVEDWIKGCGDVAQGREVLNSLASLKRGEGWAWWPEGGFLERLTFPAIRTFDSSATPTDGDSKPAPKSAAVDLTEIRAALADAVREAEENDPKLLKAELAKLRKVAASGSGASPEQLQAEYSRGVADGRAHVAVGMLPILDRIETLAGGIADAATGARSEIESLRSRAIALSPVRQIKIESVAGSTTQIGPLLIRSSAAAAAPGALGRSGKRRMLVALAQNPDGLMFSKLSLLTGISRNGGTWRIYLKELRDAGWIEGDEPVRITAAGMKELGAYEPLPTGAELVQWWRGRLGGSGKRKIFDAIVAAWPHPIAAERISEQTGIAMTGGTWRIYLKELRDLELITGKSELRASEDLFR